MGKSYKKDEKGIWCWEYEENVNSMSNKRGVSFCITTYGNAY